MSDQVQFDEDSFGMSKGGTGQPNGAPAYDPYAFSRPKTSKMAAWFIKKGIVKSEKGANAILLVLVIINILIVYYVFKNYI
jgi:hypothetical protein